MTVDWALVVTAVIVGVAVIGVAGIVGVDYIGSKKDKDNTSVAKGSA